MPEGSHDVEIEKSTLLESGFDELGGIDWQKGCFMGQELTARMRYRGLVKKRLLPVRVLSGQPKSGAILRHDGKDAGELRMIAGDLGLALIRLEHLGSGEDQRFSVDGGGEVAPTKPDWLKL